MSTTEYNALIDIGPGAPDDEILDELDGYHAVVSRTARGSLEVIITVPAESLRQAATTALAVVAATGRKPRSLHVLTTADFDARMGLAPEPQTISVAQAAEILGVTGSAVRQRLAARSLPGSRVGRDWRLPLAEIEREASARA